MPMNVVYRGSADLPQILPVFPLAGALLLLAADAMAQHLFSPFSLPVGIVTVCLGGLYMLWLLLQDGS